MPASDTIIVTQNLVLVSKDSDTPGCLYSLNPKICDNFGHILASFCNLFLRLDLASVDPKQIRLGHISDSPGGMLSDGGTFG